MGKQNNRWIMLNRRMIRTITKRRRSVPACVRCGRIIEPSWAYRTTRQYYCLSDGALIFGGPAMLSALEQVKRPLLCPIAECGKQFPDLHARTQHINFEHRYPIPKYRAAASDLTIEPQTSRLGDKRYFDRFTYPQ